MMNDVTMYKENDSSGTVQVSAKRAYNFTQTQCYQHKHDGIDLGSYREGFVIESDFM